MGNRDISRVQVPSFFIIYLEQDKRRCMLKVEYRETEYMENKKLVEYHKSMCEYYRPRCRKTYRKHYRYYKHYKAKMLGCGHYRHHCYPKQHHHHDHACETHTHYKHYYHHHHIDLHHSECKPSYHAETYHHENDPID